ncbi:hypothetical protein MBLNU230_g7929t1 [Neophaeotheca triangularis]
MSDDDVSISGSSSEEDLATTGLIATRERRSTAGNRIADLLANLDDEELQKELLGDEEDDAEDYEGSDKGSDEDDALDSSSDDEDAAAAVEDEGLEEKEIKRAERMEAKRKRKAQDARLKLPAALKKRGEKRVKLADAAGGEEGQDVEVGEGVAPARPKKKSERVSWLPTAEDAPTRQSRRAAAVTNRETTRANLEEQAKRSEKQKSFMRDAAVREKSTRRMQLTLEQRLEKMRRIEKETARDLGRFEREEAERVRLREEALAAKRRRGIEGPVTRLWSGSAVWEGGKVTGNWKMKVKRVEGGSKAVEEIEEMVAPKKQEADEAKVTEEPNIVDMGKAGEAVDVPEKHSLQPEAAKPASVQGTQTVSLPTRFASASQTHPEQPAAMDSPSVSSNAGQSTQPQSTNVTPPKPQQGDAHPATQPLTQPSSVSWLQGIQEYATQPSVQSQSGVSTAAAQPPQHPHQQLQAPYTPSAPALNAAPQPPPSNAPPPYAPLASALPGAQLPPSKTLQPSTSTYPTWPPGQGAFSINQPSTTATPTPLTPVAPPPPPEPLIREQALRTLLILESFPSLSEPTITEKPSRRSTSKAATQTNPLDPTPLSTTLLGPDAYPTFTPSQRTYLTARHRTQKKEPVMPPAPPALMCSVQHTVKAKYRDAKTGLGYADLHAYKGLQRVLAGGTMWSALLGCWVGPSYGAMGRPARGVVEGFAGPVPEKKEVGKVKDKEKEKEKEKEKIVGGDGDGDVKMEGAA